MLSQGFAALDEIMCAQTARAARLELRGLFHRYGTRFTSETHRAGIRSDLCQCLCEHEANALGMHHTASAIRMLKAIGHELTRTFDEAFTVAPCAQIACFPGGGTFYQRHGDNLYQPMDPSTAPSGFNNWRAFTILMYLNPAWTPDDGGCLRIYGECGGVPPLTPLPQDTLSAKSSFVDLEPLAGRVVVFNSLLHHEVMPVMGIRCALTIWIWKEDANREKFGRS
ncbi:hypothetical protein AB1Y20_002296 [Prymnesium parvum]|uniref:Fe2OG dioxygenase domain-containing protein n=1 Tax=Prymnesium parvum TaxID=97485 RepID=A0AB34JAV4_PRYPA